jgi:hypothetical protein
LKRALFIGALLACASCAEDECVERMEEVEGCRLQYRDDNVCDTSHGECAIACHHEAGCAVLESIGRGDEPPESYTRCVAKCSEPFRCDEGGTTIDARWRCDGEADCRDGADEDGCQYFECEDGQLVSEDARCDEWSECADGSDEEGC